VNHAFYSYWIARETESSGSQKVDFHFADRCDVKEALFKVEGWKVDRFDKHETMQDRST